MLVLPTGLLRTGPEGNGQHQLRKLIHIRPLLDIPWFILLDLKKLGLLDALLGDHHVAPALIQVKRAGKVQFSPVLGDEDYHVLGKTFMGVC